MKTRIDVQALRLARRRTELDGPRGHSPDFELEMVPIGHLPKELSSALMTLRLAEPREGLA